MPTEVEAPPLTGRSPPGCSSYARLAASRTRCRAWARTRAPASSRRTGRSIRRESGVKRWDVAAGSLLVREAGGEVSEVDHIGSDTRPGVVATNGKIPDAIRALLE